MGLGKAEVHRSVSTLQQPVHPPATPERSALVTLIADRILALGPGRLRVGIDGFTAAGKTSFGHELAEQISRAGRPTLRPCLDDFKKPWRDRHLYDRELGEGYYRNAYDYAAVIELLLEPGGPDGSGKCVLCSIDPLTQVNHTSVKTRAAANAVLVVDGVFAFRPEINDYWDFRIWINVDPETSVRRGGERDQYWAGSEAETLHRTRYLPAERLYLAQVDPLKLVDVVIDNTDFSRPRLLRY
jgi:uridine kinase